MVKVLMGPVFMYFFVSYKNFCVHVLLGLGFMFRVMLYVYKRGEQPVAHK